jgi:predicted ATP-grasp superfamily ATP-dependent carboligase
MQLDPTTHSPRVLITDAAERSMLATCRGLHAAGYEVSAAAFRGLTTSHWSRYCSDRVRVSDPRVDAARFVADLRRYLERHRCAMVIPGSDFSLFALSQRRDVLAGLTPLAMPPHTVVQRSFNREVLAAAAAQAGLEPAAAVRCGTVDEAVAAADRFGYPVLMKSISTVRDLGAVVAAGPDTHRFADEAQLRAGVSFYGSQWLVQKLASGKTLSFGGVMAGGKLIAIAVSLYLRTWPPQAGNVAFSVTIKPPRGLEEAVQTLLREVGWEGMFELELIQDDRGAITPIDLNPRPYGSMALAIAGGANLPGLWCDWVLERDPQPAAPEPGSTSTASPSFAAALSAAVAVPAAVVGATVACAEPVSVAAVAPASPARAQPGRHYRWEDADLRYLLWQVRRGHWRAAARTLRPWPGVVHAHFRLSDPLPMLVRALVLAVGKVRARVFGRTP